MNDESDAQAPIDDGQVGESDDPVQMSLLGGVATGADMPDRNDPEMTVGNRLLGHGTLLLALIVLVAVGGLLVMRWTQSDLSAVEIAEDVEARIEVALTKFANPDMVPKGDPLRKQNVDALLNDTDDILKKFTGDPTVHQVPIEYVKKNPFTLPEAENPEPDSVGPVASSTRSRREVLEQELDKLKLESVIGGNMPLAVINGQFVKAGQSVGGFTLTKVGSGSRSVEMASEGMTFTLSMSD